MKQNHAIRLASAADFSGDPAANLKRFGCIPGNGAMIVLALKSFALLALQARR